MKRVVDLFNLDSLKPLYDKANRLSELNAVWESVIPDLANLCQIANYENGELTLEVFKSTFATRIRFEIPEIKKRLLQINQFKDLKSIQYKTSYSLPKKKVVPKTKNTCPSGGKLLAKTAETIKDPKLKESLARLAKQLCEN